MLMVIMLVRKKAVKLVSCAALRGRMIETRRRNRMKSGGMAMMLRSQPMARSACACVYECEEPVDATAVLESKLECACEEVRSRM